MAELTRVTQQSFEKGANLAVSPYLSAKEQSGLVTNLVYDEHGALRTRDGTLIQDQAAPANIRIVALIDWVKMQTATPFKLALGYSTADNRLRLYNRTTNPWTVIGANPLVGNPGYLIPQFVPFQNVLLVTVGLGGPYYYYDGTTLAASAGTVPPGVYHLAVHLNSVFAWGTSAVAGQPNDGPSTLRVSVPAATQVKAYTGGASFPGANVTHVDREDGDLAAGIGEFTVADAGISPTSVILLYKNFAVYQVTGLPGSVAPLFTIQKVKTDMGCVAPRTIRFAPGFGIIRLTHRGFALYDGINDTLISEEINPYLFGRGGYGSGINWGAVAIGHAIVVPSPPLYLCWLADNGSSTPNVCFAYDLVRKAWSVLTYATNLSCSHQRTQLDPTTNPPGLTGVNQIIAGDTSALRVRRLWAGDTDDDGTAITWSWIARRVSGASAQGLAYFRRMILKVVNVTTAQSIAWGVLFGPNTQGTTPRNKTGTFTTPNAAARTQTFNGTALVPNPELDLTAELGLIADNAQAVISGAGPITIRGLEWHVRPKPTARPSVFA